MGAKNSRQVNVRIIAATHRNLSQAVAEGAFREDLYYRLNVLNLTVPPLRMRRDDIPLLARHFLARCARSLRKSVQGFSPDAMALLSAYGWPGNVRELENSMNGQLIWRWGTDPAVDYPWKPIHARGAHLRIATSQDLIIHEARHRRRARKHRRQHRLAARQSTSPAC